MIMAGDIDSAVTRYLNSVIYKLFAYGVLAREQGTGLPSSLPEPRSSISLRANISFRCFAAAADRNQPRFWTLAARASMKPLVTLLCRFAEMSVAWQSQQLRFKKTRASILSRVD